MLWWVHFQEEVTTDAMPNLAAVKFVVLAEM